MNNPKKNSLIIALVTLISFASVLVRSEFLSSFLLFSSFSYLIFFVIRNVPHRLINRDKLLIIIPFLLGLLGIIFTDRYGKSFEFLLRLSPLLFIPLLYGNLDLQIGIKAYNFIFKFFPVLTILVFSLYIIIGITYIVKGYGNYLYYSNFSAISDIHTTYLGLIINLSLWFVLKRKGAYTKIIYYSFFLCFFVFQIIIASKVSLFICVLLITLDILLSLKTILSKVLVATLIVVVSIFSIKHFIENRFWTEKLQQDMSLSGEQIFSNFLKNDVNARMAIWKSNIESLTGNKWIYGNGTNASNEKRIINYKKNNLQKAYEESYNAHNQFIEVLYSFGVVGLILFIVHFLTILKFALNTKDIKYNFIIYCCFLLYFITESILQRTIGIVLYAFIITYIYIQSMLLRHESK